MPRFAVGASNPGGNLNHLKMYPRLAAGTTLYGDGSTTGADETTPQMKQGRP